MKMTKNKKKNMKIHIGASALCLLFALSSPLTALASPEFARSEEEWARLRDDRLEWEEIDGLVNEYNYVVINNRMDLEDNSRKSAEDIRNDLLDSAGELDDLAAEADSTDGGSMTAATYRMQAEQLRQSAQDSVSDSEVLRLQYKAVEASLSDSVRSYFISYHSAIVQKAYDEKQAELARIAYDSTLNKKNVGMATELEVLSAEEALQTAQAAVITDDSNIASAKVNMMVLCGWDYTASPEIEEMPSFDIESSDDMNIEEDIEKALQNNYTLKADERKLENAPSYSIKQKYKETCANDREQIASDIKQKASAVKLAKSGYDQAANALALQRRDLETKRAQASLGTISVNELRSAELTVSSMEGSLKLKEYELFSALSSYNSAVAGTASTGATA